MDIIRELILRRLDEKRLTMSEASALIGRNTSYLQQFLKRGVPAELHERDRIRLADVLGISESDLRGSSAPLPTRAYRNNHTAAQHNPRSHIPVSSDNQNLGDTRLSSGIMANSDLPVYGSKDNNDGTFTLSANPVGRTARPDVLAKVNDAYGIIVADDSMEPAIELGSTVFVDPHTPCRSGRYCVLKKTDDDGHEIAMIRRLISRTKTSLVVHQNTPKADQTLKRSEWTTCQLVVGLLFPR